jgi:hypothetical protein
MYELFGFVASFKHYKFVHGNLHMDNIFVNAKTFDDVPRFYVIDLANAYIIRKRHTYPPYKRTSYFGEYEKKEYDCNFMYWDIFTMYASLKKYFMIDRRYVDRLEKLKLSYIPQDVLEQLMLNYFRDDVHRDGCYDEFVS